MQSFLFSQRSHTQCVSHTHSVSHTHFIPTFHRISIVVHVQRLEKQHTRACMTISHTYLVLFSLTYTAYLFLPLPTHPPRLLSPPLSSFLTLFTRVLFLPRTLVPPSHVDSITPTHFPLLSLLFNFPSPFCNSQHTHTLHTTVFHNTTHFPSSPPPPFPLSYSLSLSLLSLSL